MPKTRTQKEDLVAVATKKFGDARGAIFVDFAGMGIDETDQIRADLRGEAGSDAEFLVLKKSLIRIAAKNAGWGEIPESALDGQVALALSYADEVAAAQRVAAFAKKVKKDKKLAEARPKILGGIMDGAAIDAAKAEFLSGLPGKDALRGQVVGTLVAPLRSFIGIGSSGLLGGLARVLDARREKLAAEG